MSQAQVLAEAMCDGFGNPALFAALSDYQKNKTRIAEFMNAFGDLFMEYDEFKQSCKEDRGVGLVVAQCFHAFLAQLFLLRSLFDRFQVLAHVFLYSRFRILDRARGPKRWTKTFLRSKHFKLSHQSLGWELGVWTDRKPFIKTVFDNHACGHSRFLDRKIPKTPPRHWQVLNPPSSCFQLWIRFAPLFELSWCC